MKYYIGVDGGGTKTAFALFDENKNMLDSVTGPGSNHENLESSFDGASDIMMEGLNALCAKAGIICSAFIDNSGLIRNIHSLAEDLDYYNARSASGGRAE